MVKIRISYTERKELQKVLQILKPVILKVKHSDNKEGVYKKAYLDLNL